eukprot:4499180-Pleurochrysis_carterae.AAC.1
MLGQIGEEAGKLCVYVSLDASNPLAFSARQQCIGRGIYRMGRLGAVMSLVVAVAATGPAILVRVLRAPRSDVHPQRSGREVKEGGGAERRLTENDPRWRIAPCRALVRRRR